MKVSQIGLISKKLTNIDEQFPVQDMLLKTGQIDQFASGIYAYGHIPYLVLDNIKRIISKILTKYGASELLLPLLQPERIWEESGRLEKYVNDDVMFRCLTEKGNFCLAPTAEEAIVTYAKSRLSTYKQLPVTYFQTSEKFRNELRSRGFLLRGKTFLMMDAYSFGKDQNDLDYSYSRMKEAYLEIFKTLGIDIIPVGADSGDMGGNKSEEFMCLSDIGEDTILVDESTNKAFNTELLERENYQEYLRDNYGIDNIDSLVTKKACELGHIFKLGDKYSSSMNATFTNEEDNQTNFMMGCYGIGVSRTLAMIYENSILKHNGKFDGISLPLVVAPYILYIIPKDDDKDKLNTANTLYEELVSKDIPVLFDDRSDMSIGAKIKDSLVTGTPYVCVFGKTLEEGYVEIESTKTGEKTKVEIDNFISYVSNLNSNR